MNLPQQATRLCIYLGEDDRLGGRPLFEAIVEQARKQGLAGATVLRGVSGFGANSRIKTSKILMLSEDLPVLVEIVDAPDKIERFLPYVDEVLGEGLVTMEPVTVLYYRHSGRSGQGRG